MGYVDFQGGLCFAGVDAFMDGGFVVLSLVGEAWFAGLGKHLPFDFSPSHRLLTT